MNANNQILIVLDSPGCHSTDLVLALRYISPKEIKIVLVDEIGAIINAPPGFIEPPALKSLFDLWRRSPDEYDSIIQLADLKKFPILGAVLVATPTNISKPLVRNMAVHCIDAARICRDKFCLVPRKSMGHNHEDFENALRKDEHLFHSLLQMYGEIEFDTSQFPVVVDFFKYFLNKRTEVSNHIQRQERKEAFSKFAVVITMLICHISLLSALIVAVAFAIWRRQPPDWVPWKYFVALYTAYWGMHLAEIPTKAAFDIFYKDKYTNLLKKRLYIQKILFHGIILLFFFIEGYFTPAQIHSLCIGFIWGIVAENHRGYVFLKRIRLQSLTSAYRAPAYDGPPFSIFNASSTGHNRWDEYARRMYPVSRNFFFQKPLVFISYGWNDNDRIFAEELKRYFDGIDLFAFLERERIVPGSMWRAEIADKIFYSTHFLFLASPRSIHGRTCADEVRFALELTSFSTHPTISICVIEEIGEDMLAQSDPVFQYIWKRAQKVTPHDLQTRASVLKWLNNNMPSCWLSDLGIKGCLKDILIIIGIVIAIIFLGHSCQKFKTTSHPQKTVSHVDLGSK